jgi:hypothetical protein
MACEVRVIEDSLNPYNKIRLTTLQLRYWRGIHAEFMTHRVFSRNASSSRAIPVSTFLKQVWNDPATPVHWGANQPGMKARTELTGFKKWFAQFMWKTSGRIICCLVWLTNKVSSPHKQVFNRLLEPWQYISVIVTSTEWDNFFELRNHPDAQPEIQELAREMKYAMDNSKPTERYTHVPYITGSDRIALGQDASTGRLMQISTARCARVSYFTHDKQIPEIEKDLKLFNDLVGSVPIHASPTEHQATALDSEEFNKNFRGWSQFRNEVETNIQNKGNK